MPRYRAPVDRVRCGVPLGGLGTGKVELWPDGTLGAWTMEAAPALDPDGRAVGWLSGLLVEESRRRVARLLTTQRLRWPTVRRITYEGRFPAARLTFHEPRWALRVSLRAHAPLQLGASRASAMPGALLVLSMTNPTARDVHATWWIGAANPIGPWQVGRYNAVERRGGAVSLIFRHRAQPDAEMALTLPAAGSGRVTVLPAWNLQRRFFRFDWATLNLQPWEQLYTDSLTPLPAPPREVRSESVECGGAISCRLRLPPGATREVPLALTWRIPTQAGHRYERLFGRAAATGRRLLQRRHSLAARQAACQRLLDRAGLPPWLVDAVLNNLYPLISSSRWTRDDRFALLEAPQACPLLGTLDVRYYGSWALLMLFPELEVNELRQFARAQRPDGYLPHDLGRGEVALPSNGTTAVPWRDLNPKFVLMVYRDVRWLGRRSLLRECYPHVLRALRWMERMDHNGDGLPDHLGQDQTYDLWNLRGTIAYTSGITLAALSAAERMAHALGDARTRRWCAQWREHARGEFARQLWTGRYVRAARDGETRNDACTLHQLNGQWYAGLLGLPPILERRQIRQAIAAMLRLNVRGSRFGAVNSVWPNGRRDHTCIQSANIWPGQVYAFASLAIQEGFRAQGLAVARRVWETFARRVKSPWNQPDTLSADDGRFLFGDYYMRNLVIWTVPLALLGWERMRRLTQAMRRGD